MKKAIRIGGRIAAVLLLVISSLLLVLYQQGYYDFSFIKRPPGAMVGEGTAEQERESEVLPTEPLTPEENIRDVFEQSGALSEQKGDYESKNGKIPAAERFFAAGWSVDSGDFDLQKHRLLRVTPADALPTVFSYGKMTVKEPMRVESPDGGYETVLKVYETDRPALSLYMGHIFADDGGKTSLLSGDGEMLIAKIDREQLLPAYQRTVGGDPLFVYKGGYYKLASGTGMLLAVEESEVRQTALRFDYPIDYGLSDGKIFVFFDGESGLYGYRSADESVVIEPQFEMAYEFGSNAYAAVIDEGVQKFIDRSGRVVIDAFGWLYYNQRREVFDGYYAPDTNGIESLGMFYFDEGLVRVRRHLIDYYHRTKTADDMDLLLYENGEEFPLPGGYTLVGYSDGVALLEKDGLYGFLDRTGYWIAQPIYTYAQPFSEGLAVIGFADGKKGMIDKEGNVILSFVYDHVSSCSSGVVLTFESDHGWQILNKAKQN